MNKTLSLIFVIGFCCLNNYFAQKLLINEISQGISGNREFVEFIVNTANPGQCPDENECVDIRGWIFDDNNGYFSDNDLTGTGIAFGAMRFSNNAIWSCLKPGTIITIYDVSETNTSIPSQDISTTDGNCQLVIPINSNLFEKHETRPSSSNNTYSSTGWTSGGNWSLIAMQNDNDSFQVIDPATLLPVHAVSYGNNNSNNFIYFSGSASGLAFQCVNSNSTNFSEQSNWISVAATNQSPGTYNSVANENFSNAINAICGDPYVATLTSTDDNCGGACEGSASLSLSGGSTPYSVPIWSNSNTGLQINGLCEGDYSVTVQDNAGCEKTIDFSIAVIGTPSQINVTNDLTICNGETVTLTANGPANVNWLPLNQTGLSINVSPTSTTTYTVEDVNAISCFSSNTVTVTVIPLPSIAVGSSINPSACAVNDGEIVINGTETGNISWQGTSNGSTNNVTLPFTLQNLAAGTYTFNFTNTNNCQANPVSITLTEPNAPPTPTISASGPLSFCEGGSVTLTSSSTSNNMWSTGETTQSILVTNSGNFFVTVTINGCSATSAVTQVVENTLPIVSAGNDVSVCEGEQVTLSGSGALNYTWDNGISNGIPFSPNFGLGGVDFTVTGIDANGCQNTDQVLVYVNPLPIVNVGNIFNVCLNNSAFELTAFENINGGLWSFNGNTITSTFNPATFGVGSHSLTYTYTDQSTSCSNSANKIIQVNALPPIEAGTDVSVCEGNPVTLNATGTAGFTWNNGITNGVSFVPTSSGIYTVSVTDINNCSNSDMVAVSVVPTPNVFAGLDLEVCGNMEITLSASGASTYTWDNGVIDGVPFIPNSTQTYTVIGYTDEGCTNSDQITITVNPLQSFDLGNDYTSCDGSPLTLNIPNNYQHILWSNGNTSNNITINTSGLFSVTAWNNGNNIIVNGDFSGGTTASDNNFSTSYNPGVMGAFGLLSDAGTYAISTSPSLAHFNFSNCGDHTSGNGNMLICNGSNIANTPIWCQTVAVQPNTDYNFSCWAMNAISNPDNSQLQFYINGIQLGDVFSTSITGCQWQEFFNLWNSGSNTTAELCIYNQSILESGNDFAIDDIYFSPICSVKDEILVSIENISIDAGNDVSICAGESVQLNAQINGTGNSEELTFSNNLSFPIFDNIQIESTISVTGLNQSTSIDIASVCLNIDHTWTSDLDISLRCPNGTIIDLSSDNGGSGQNFTNTCFKPNSPSISNGVAPFSGDFSPEQDFSLLSACDGNGIWTLLVADDGAGDIGQLINWTITFNNEVDLTNFIWTPISNILNQETLSPTVNPTNTTTYNISLTSPSGNCVVNDDVTVFVDNTGNATFSYPQSTYCLSDINPIPITGSSGGTFTSTPNGLVFLDNVGTIDLANSQIGSYTITYTLNSGCNPIAEFQIEILDNPVINPQSDLVFCDNQTVNEISFTGTNNAVLNWTNDNPTIGLSASGIGSIPSFTATNTGTIALVSTISVTPSIGTCIGNPISFTITIENQPSIFAGNDVTICQGESVTLSGSGGQNYQWSNNVQDGVPFTPNATTTYTLTSDAIGTCGNTDEVTVFVNALPNIDPIANKSYCEGDIIQNFQANPSGGTWTGNGIINANNGTFDPSLINLNTSETITYSYTNALNCTNYETFEVIVYPLPNINAGLDVLTCPEGSVILNATGGISYEWNNNVINNQAFSPIEGTYSVVGTDINGCQNTDDLNIIFQEVNLLPIEDFSICLGESVTISTSNAQNYTWTPTNFVLPNGSSASVFPNQTTTFKVIGELNQCFDSITFTVTVLPIPNVEAGNDTIICRNQSITLFATGNANSYLWENSIQNNSVYTPNISSYIHVIGTLGECSSSDSIFVTLEEIPSVEILNNFTDGCFPLTIDFQQNSNGAISYLWDFGDDNFSTLENPTHTYTSAGYASVTLEATSLNGCKNTIKIDSLIHAIQKPLANFAASHNEISIDDNIVNFTNLSQFAENYIWNFDYKTSSNELHPTHSFEINETQNVFVQLIAQAGENCFDTTNMVIVVNEKLIYYIPNSFTPNDDEYNQTFKPIFYSGINENTYQFQVFNRWGELIFESLNPSVGWDGTYNNILCKLDTYIWKLNFETKTGDRINKSGSINLLK